MSAFTRTNLKIVSPKTTSQEGFLESMVKRLYIQRFPVDTATNEANSSKNSRTGSKAKEKNSSKLK